MTVAERTPPPVASPSANDVEPFRWQWTREDLIRLYELGMFRGHRVMLIDGEVLAMSPMKSAHANGIVFALQQLQLAFGSSFTVRPQLPLDLGQTTDPEPDLAVVVGTARSHPTTPTTAVLVLEVSDTSLAFDLGDKASLYAAAGIEDYWVLDVVSQRLHIHRDPRRDSKQRFGFAFRNQQILGSKDRVAPLAAPDASILVADLLP